MGIRSKRRKVKERLERRTNKYERLKYFEKAPSFKDNQGNLLSSHQLVFPILRKVSWDTFVTVGTGFFVHPAGGFVTAKHCLFIGEKYDENCYAVQTIGQGQHFIRKIQYFEAHPKADIGVGMLRGELKDGRTGEIVLMASFPISLKAINLGDKISTLAYPRMKINDSQVGTFPCDKFTGEVKEYFSNGTAWLKDECYMTNMLIQSMASGGPALRGTHIIGVNSSSMSLSVNEEPISFITPIDKVFDLVLKDGEGVTTSVKELMNSGHMPFAD